MVPVLGLDGNIVGALSVSGPANTTTRERLESTLPALHSAGTRISQRRSYG